MNQLDINTERFYQEFGNSRKKQPLSDEYLSCIDKYKMAHKNMQFWKDLVDQTRDELLKLADGEDLDSDDLKITHYEEKGRVDYSSIKELENVDLDSYRKPAVIKSRITLTQY